METTKQIIADENLISYCGFYCGACPKFLKEQCKGCKQAIVSQSSANSFVPSKCRTIAGKDWGSRTKNVVGKTEEQKGN